MKIKELEIYLNNLYFIKDIELKLENAINDSELYIIEEISTFIINNSEYSSKESFLELSDGVVYFIENYNNGTINATNIKDNYILLKKSISNFKKELEKEWQINIYFYGKDQYGLIDNKLSMYPIKKIINQKQLNITALKKNNPQSKIYNILFVTENIKFKNNFFDEVLNYNQIALSMQNASEMLYTKTYQYRFIKSALSKSMYDNSKTSIIIGNSYPLVGINNDIIGKNTVNLSASSQDLYYSFELCKKAVLMNHNIKECIFGISHYLLRHDLSRGESDYSKYMINYLYIPLLKDCHNSKDKNIPEIPDLNTFGVDILLRTIFDLEKVETYFGLKIYENNNMFYNEKLNPRNLPLNWSELEQEQKEEYGRYRANEHNKLYKYENTKEEYSRLLNEFINFLKDNNVELKCVVFPTTKYYEKNISKEFKEEFAEIIKYLKEENIKVIDLRLKNEYFTDADFADSDHLNDLGAIKATNFIKEEL